VSKLPLVDGNIHNTTNDGRRIGAGAGAADAATYVGARAANARAASASASGVASPSPCESGGAREKFHTDTTVEDAGLEEDAGLDEDDGLEEAIESERAIDERLTHLRTRYREVITSYNKVDSSKSKSNSGNQSTTDVSNTNDPILPRGETADVRKNGNECNPVVAVAKHLCGVATDLTLTALQRYSSFFPTKNYTRSGSHVFV
jgi:hypothetical protein